MTINTSQDLSQKVVIVTGAGSGIGRAMALRFAGAGAKVLVADVGAKTAEETHELIKADGGTSIVSITDVGDEASVNTMVALAASTWGRIDVLCNNAGVMDRMEPVGDVTTAQWDRILRVNLSSVMYGTRAVLPHMLERGAGAIINTASIAGLRGGSAGAAYTASKHAIVGLTKNTAWAYAKRGIRCNAICPGAVDTNVSGGLGLAAFDPSGLALYGPILAVNERIAAPDQIATVALFLASDAASFVNGAILPADGGWVAG